MKLDEHGHLSSEETKKLTKHRDSSNGRTDSSLRDTGTNSGELWPTMGMALATKELN